MRIVAIALGTWGADKGNNRLMRNGFIIKARSGSYLIIIGLLGVKSGKI